MNGCESDGDENEGKSKSIVANDVVSIHATHTDAKEEIVAYRNGVVEASDICVPTDDVANLEWLSHFVEDSFTEYSLTCALPVKPTVERLPVEASGKPTKARSKRARSFSGSETTSSASSTTSFSFETTEDDPSYTAAMMKKRKFSKPSEGNKMAQNRRCSHCGVQKTPQWRAGPLGAKTLCNACGVRFKSGRLFPEYRPACSPTFSIKLHSNNHRKVLEMRHNKEVKPPESGRVPAVSSF